MRRRRQSARPRDQMPKAGPHDPYCGFTNDRERRQALRNREVCGAVKVVVVVTAAVFVGLAGQPVHAALVSLLRLLP